MPQMLIPCIGRRRLRVESPAGGSLKLHILLEREPDRLDRLATLELETSHAATLERELRKIRLKKG